MNIHEELELPPWEKFRVYGLFPYKLFLHFSLVILTSTLVIILNQAYSSYSRSIWQSSVNILFPPDYTDYQIESSSPFEYYIYTINRTISDSNRLINQYFILPNESISTVDIFSTPGFSIAPPSVTVRTTDSSETYDILSANSADWPLALDNLSNINVRAFFSQLISMDFQFYLRSSGSATKSSASQQPVCFNWKWTIRYSLASGGQVFVKAIATMLSSCASVPTNSPIYAVSVAILIASLWYQILLLKAIARQLILISKLVPSDFVWATKRRQGNSAAASPPNRGAASSGNPNVTGRSSGNSRSSYRPPTFNSSVSNSNSVQALRNVLRDSNLSDSVDDGSVDNDNTAEDGSVLMTRPSGERLSGLSHGGNEDHHRPLISATSIVRDRTNTSASFNSDAGRSRLVTLTAIEEDFRTFKEAFEMLTWRDRLAILNLWFIVSTLGNIFALIASCSVVFSREDLVSTPYLKGALGLACLMYWFALVQYLEFFPRYYIMISMLKITVPRVSKFLLGVLPLFIGYALLGLLCFGDMSDQFGDFIETLRTLFAVVNGDVIYETFMSIEFAGIGGQIYLYLYTLLFTYIVLMTIIAIVEEAFFQAQDKKGFNKKEEDDDDAEGSERDGGRGRSRADRNRVDSKDDDEGDGGDSLRFEEFKKKVEKIHKNRIKNETLIQSQGSLFVSADNSLDYSVTTAGTDPAPPQKGFHGTVATKPLQDSNTLTNPLLPRKNSEPHPALQRTPSLRGAADETPVKGGMESSSGGPGLQRTPSLRTDDPYTLGRREIPENLKLFLRTVEKKPSSNNLNDLTKI